MSYPDILTLFSPYIQDAALLAPFASATVADMQVNRAERFLRMTLRMDGFVPFEAFPPIEEALAAGLGLRTVELQPQYPEDALCEACFPTIVSFLRRRCVAVNGTFNDATYAREGEGFSVTLCHGGMDMIYATHTGNPTDSEVLLAKLQEIDALKAQIAALEETLGREAAPEVCPTCGAEKKDDAPFCGECGGPL